VADPRFYDNRGPVALGVLAEAIGGRLAGNIDSAFSVRDIADAQSAADDELCLAVNARYLGRVRGRVAVIVPPSLEQAALASGLLPIVHDAPASGFALAAHRFYPMAGRDIGPSAGTPIDPSAKLGRDVAIEAGVVIGPGAEVGDSTRIAANAVVGRGVCIGRQCFIGPGVTVTHALVGDRVTLHAGVRIGTDGFGYASGPAGHRPIPQLGRVIIQDDVDIGANSCVDRGALGDTTIGEGTKIDNLVQIGHNDTIGRRALIAAQVGLSGSVAIGDWTVLGGQVGVADHVAIGSRVRVAAKSGITKDLADGQDYAGYPAQTAGMWRREVALLRRMTKGYKLRDE
jgi:UDP-3-O-[3-hydroxymyristoyl] glucosamine N-acyltransferase